MNTEGYQSVLKEDWWPKMDELDLNDMWFQQDFATCRTANVTMELLQDKFGKSIISRNSIVKWSPLSCDLNPWLYSLWCYLKSIAYSQKPQTNEPLEKLCF